MLFYRSIPDVVGYLHLCGLPILDATLRTAELCRYAWRVFLALHRPAIFAQDTERKQSRPKPRRPAGRSRRFMRLGYELVPLSFAPFADRVRFVLSCIA